MIKEIAQEHPISAGLAILLILLLSWLGPSLFTTGTATDPRILAALIYVLGGALVTYVLRDILDTKRQKARIASALLAEIVIQCSSVLACCKLTQKHFDIDTVFDGGYSRRDFRSTRPAPPILFPALADRLALFPDHVIVAVVSLYGAVEHVNRLIAELPEKRLSQRSDDNALDDDIICALNIAAAKGLIAMQQLGQFSGRSLTQSASLRQELAKYATSSETTSKHG